MSELRVFNRQKARPLDARLLRRITRHLLDTAFAWPESEIAVHLIDTREMARMNQDFLGHAGSTDVITFDLTETAGPRRGEIFISAPDAVAQARDFDTSWQEEIARYVIHGLLHLDGCDDLRPDLRRAMKRRENKLLKELSRRFDLRKLHRR